MVNVFEGIEFDLRIVLLLLENERKRVLALYDRTRIDGQYQNTRVDRDVPVVLIRSTSL